MRYLVLTIFMTAACTVSAPDAPAGAPAVFPDALYLGVEDSGAKYAAPIAVQGGGPMAYSVADVSIASASGDDQLLAVGALHAGATQVVAKNALGQATIGVTVIAYSASARMAGAQAWTKYNCAGCHDSGPDVTPSGIAKHTDAQLAGVVTMGQNPEGGEVSLGKSQHSFAIASSDPAYVGIAAYMRSLPARGVPHADP